jgi:cytochrome c553
LFRSKPVFQLFTWREGTAGGANVGGVADQSKTRLGQVQVVEERVRPVAPGWRGVPRDYRHDRHWDMRMEHFSDRHHLADAQAIADVASYVNHLAIEVPPGVGDGELVDHGAQVYAEHCRSCHGRSADGDEKAMIPRIAGQHYEYLTRQIYDAVDGRRPNFSKAHVRCLARLGRDDIVGLADYLSRLSQPPAHDENVRTAAR